MLQCTTPSMKPLCLFFFLEFMFVIQLSKSVKREAVNNENGLP